jgi:hypothetical protein
VGSEEGSSRIAYFLEITAYFLEIIARTIRDYSL